MYCRKCGAEIVSGAKFCGNCGSNINVNEDSMQQRTCPACKEKVKISPDYPYCSNCGTNLGNLLKEIPAVQVKEDKAEIVKVKEEKTQKMFVAPQDKVEDVICPNCGRKVQKSAHLHICMYCGAELSGISASKDHDQKTMICSNCGQRITITKDRPFCPYCGNDMSFYIGSNRERKNIPIEPNPEPEHEKKYYRKRTDYHEVKVKKNTSRNTKLIAICILAAAVAGFAVFLLLEHTADSSTSNTAYKLSNTVSESTSLPHETDKAEKTDTTEKKEKADESAPSMNATSKPTATASSDYIIPDSSTRLLTESDVEGLSLKQINYAKNEIYARNGRKFNSNELQEYFNSKSWYNGTINPEDFTNDMLNSIEMRNVEFLSDKEHEINPNGYSPK